MLNVSDSFQTQTLFSYKRNQVLNSKSERSVRPPRLLCLHIIQQRTVVLISTKTKAVPVTHKRNKVCFCNMKPSFCPTTDTIASAQQTNKRRLTDLQQQQTKSKALCLHTSLLVNRISGAFGGRFDMLLSSVLNKKGVTKSKAILTLGLLGMIL